MFNLSELQLIHGSLLTMIMAVEARMIDKSGEDGLSDDYLEELDSMQETLSKVTKIIMGMEGEYENENL